MPDYAQSVTFQASFSGLSGLHDVTVTYRLSGSSVVQAFTALGRTETVTVSEADAVALSCALLDVLREAHREASNR